MPLKVLKKPGFYYVAYYRKEIDDFVDFRTMLESLSKTDTLDRDIIVDLTKGTTVTDGEFTILANVVKGFQGTKRTLRIVTNDSIKNKFDTTNLFKAGVELYADHLALFESLSRGLIIGSPEQLFAQSEDDAVREADTNQP